MTMQIREWDRERERENCVRTLVLYTHYHGGVYVLNASDKYFSFHNICTATVPPPNFPPLFRHSQLLYVALLQTDFQLRFCSSDSSWVEFSCCCFSFFYLHYSHWSSQCWKTLSQRLFFFCFCWFSLCHIYVYLPSWYFNSLESHYIRKKFLDTFIELQRDCDLPTTKCGFSSAFPPFLLFSLLYFSSSHFLFVLFSFKYLKRHHNNLNA